MRASLRRIVGASALACALSITHAAMAQAEGPSANDLAEARARYERGMDLARRGIYEQAIAELERAYALAPSFKILYNLGLAYEQLSEYPAAVRALERYLATGGANAAAAQRAEAERRLARMRPLVGRLDVRSKGAGVRI